MTTPDGFVPVKTAIYFGKRIKAAIWIISSKGCKISRISAYTLLRRGMK